jgi:hypothetical protein
MRLLDVLSSMSFSSVGGVIFVIAICDVASRLTAIASPEIARELELWVLKVLYHSTLIIIGVSGILRLIYQDHSISKS